MIELARPGHTALNQALKAQVDAELAKKKWNPHHTLDDVLEVMIDIQHPDLLPKFLAVMERVTKATKDWWGDYFMTRLIPKMPPEAIETAGGDGSVDRREADRLIRRSTGSPEAEARARTGLAFPKRPRILILRRLSAVRSCDQRAE